VIDEYFKLALNSILNRKLRSWLTMVGIFIGVAAVVALTSLGEGMQAAIQDQFEKAGADRILVFPGNVQGFTGMAASQIVSAKLTDRDVSVTKNVRGVGQSVGFLVQDAEVEYANEQKQKTIFGAPTDSEAQDFMDQMDFFVVDGGQKLKPSHKYKATVGREFAKTGFRKEIHIGHRIEIVGQEFEVVGLNKLTGNPFHDGKITIPLETAQELFDKDDTISMVSIKVKPSFDPGEVAEVITRKLRRSRDVKEDEEDFNVQTSEELVRSFSAVINVVQVLLTGIAAISLLVGGIGIMTTMYTSVLERTREIGVMKAVGARNSDILTIFLIESGVLGTIGGIIGIAFGLGISKAVEMIALQAMGTAILKAKVSAGIVGGALLFSFTIGCISGLLPAKKAAEMRPVEAIRFR